MLFLFATLFVLVNGNTKTMFNDWIKQYNKVYDTDLEYRYRYSVFAENIANIEERNANSKTYKLQINEFADLTTEEFESRYLHGYTHHDRTYNKNQEKVELPQEVDWTKKGAVTPVKNQGECGSCWSFSTTGAVEGAWFLHSGELISLSEQQLIDCSGPEGNDGCNGGMMDYAFEYIIKNGGICSENNYPYSAENGTCVKCNPVVKISGYVDVQPNNETALMAAVAKQPVSVAVEADGFDWQFYFGGIVTDSCGTNVDHGVLIVGYGIDESTNQTFWKVKNSWGATWGEQGYIRLGRGSKFSPNGECGILMSPSYPVV